MARSGEICEGCKAGRYYISRSVRSNSGAYQIRELRCNGCGRKHEEKLVVLAEQVRRRKFDE